MENGSLFLKVRKMFQVEEELDEAEQKKAVALIRNIFRYMDKDAKDIMTHRKDIVAIDGNDKLDDVLKFMLSESFSRYPVFKEDIDEIVGFLHLKEAMLCYMQEELRNLPVFELKDCIRPVALIPETKSIDKLFKEMQAAKKHIAVVIDEYGQTSGIVTLEDILEEIVGNIMDEHDDEDEEISHMSDGTYQVDGLTELEDLEELLGIKFEKEDYGTLNGFLIDQLDRVLSEDDTEISVVEYEGFRFTVLAVDNNTIETVKIEKI